MHPTVRRARWRTPAAVALAAALVISACGDGDEPAASDDGTTTTTTTDDASTTTEGATTAAAQDEPAGPEEVASFDGFSIWRDNLDTHLLRLDDAWVPEDDGTVTTPEGAGPLQLSVDGSPVRLLMSQWTDLGALAEGDHELELALLDEQGEPVSGDGGPAAAGELSVGAADDTAHSHAGDAVEWAEAPTLGIELSEVASGGWMVRSTVTGFSFAPEHVGAATVDGEGHLHLHVDGEKLGRVYGELHHLPVLEPGSHEIELTMATNDHQAVAGEDGTPVTAMVTVVVNDDAAADNPYLAEVAGSTTSTTAATTTTAAPAADHVFEVAFVRGGPVGGLQRHAVPVGSTVAITVTSDVDDELHLHGYEIEQELVANQPTTLSFSADLPGVWELETHGHGGVPLLELEVS
jgi:hypothetical protein